MSPSAVSLRVFDLETSQAFYRDKLGFHEIGKESGKAALALSRDSRPILFLSEDKNAGRHPDVPGLYHVAYLYSTRKELAGAFRRLYEHQWPFQGFADHGVSEAIYLADPEGNGIELYADRPRDKWVYHNGRLQMTTERLDLENLLKEIGRGQSGEHGSPNVKIGHVHLQVSDLDKAERFYHKLVGFDVTQRDYPGALFVSAGGYHHHLGLNIWHSQGAIRPNSKILGLEQFRINIGSEQELLNLRKQLEQDGNLIEDKVESFVTHDFDSIKVEFSLS